MIRGLDLNYIILDLEWNNAYSYAKKGFMNEIIEIGAIKLNDRFDVVDTFKQLIKPKITKKLSSRCKNITNITNEQLNEKRRLSSFLKRRIWYTAVLDQRGKG